MYFNYASESIVMDTTQIYVLWTLLMLCSIVLTFIFAVICTSATDLVIFHETRLQNAGM